MTLRIKLVVFILLSFVFCTKSIAAENLKGEKSYVRNLRTILTLGGGTGFTNDAGAATTIPINDSITEEQYTYSPDSDNQTLGLFNAFLGIEFPLRQQFAGQVGLGYYYFAESKVNGILTQGADAGSSSMFPYKYKIRNNQLLLDSKWFYTCNAFRPYFALGLGAAFNNASSFDVTIPKYITFSRMYESYDATSFSYNVGLGLDYNINQYTRIGIGYRFADLGKVSLGDSTIDATPVSGTISQSHFYIHEVLAQLTFIISHGGYR